MTDDLARLESALRATSPRAPEAAREQAISEAMEAFDREFQGTGGEARQKGRVPKRGTSWIRRLAMPLSRPSLAFAGSAAVVVVAGIVSHQVFMAPQPPPSDVGRLAGDSAAPSMGERFLMAPTAPQALPGPPAPSASTEKADAGQRLAQSRELPFEVQQRAAHGRMQADSADTRESLGRFPGSTMITPATTGLTSRAVESRPGGYVEQGRDRFAQFDPNPVKVTAEEPVSTFSIDVDTASYGFMRASLNRGRLPENDAVRIEELINYFPYDYTPPETRDTPFATHVSVMPAPWNEAARLLGIGIKGYVPDRTSAPRANLVFLIDTSGSMEQPNKLPLLINSFKLLLNALAPEDRVAIVTYAGSAGVVLPPTAVSDRAAILSGLDRLDAGGSTAGAEGIRQAYRLAEQHLVAGGVNRIILATDGDFNVGISDPAQLEDYIARKRSSGVSLSVLGFGMGNYNDALMQRLAQNGDGNAAYIDTLSEARKVLLEEASSTLVTIAKDVKILVEFSPAAVSEYRLIGYETRMLAREDFRNDKVDAGDIGAGHTVTAIYELIPAGSDGERVAPLRYGDDDATPKPGFDGELAFLKIRYKLPGAATSTLITRPVTASDTFNSVDAAPRDVRFAAAVAAFGQLLRGGRYTGDYAYSDVITLARGARGEDPFGYRNEFVGLVRLAQSIAP